MFEGAMAFLPAIMTVASAIGGGMQYASQKGAGEAGVLAAQRKQQAAAYSAAQLEQIANNQIGAGQQGQEDVLRQAAYLQSKFRAQAGMSGTLATSPDLLSTQASMAAEAAYRGQMERYKGVVAGEKSRMQAESMRYQAALGLADAEAAKENSDMAANAGLFKTGASLLAMGGSFGGSSMGAKYGAGIGGPTDAGIPEFNPVA